MTPQLFLFNFPETTEWDNNIAYIFSIPNLGSFFKRFKPQIYSERVNSKDNLGKNVRKCVNCSKTGYSEKLIVGISIDSKTF